MTYRLQNDYFRVMKLTEQSYRYTAEDVVQLGPYTEMGRCHIFKIDTISIQYFASQTSFETESTVVRRHKVLVTEAIRRNNI